MDDGILYCENDSSEATANPAAEGFIFSAGAPVQLQDFSANQLISILPTNGETKASEFILTPAQLQLFCLQQGIAGYKHIRGDGNCFFRSVLAALGEDENNHMMLRTQAIQYIRDHPDIFLKAFPNQKALDDYLKRMSHDHTWAEGVIIDAVGLLCNCNIDLIDMTADPTAEGGIKISGSFRVASISDTQKTILLLRVNDNHYEATGVPIKMPAEETNPISSSNSSSPIGGYDDDQIDRLLNSYLGDNENIGFLAAMFATASEEQPNTLRDNLIALEVAPVALRLPEAFEESLETDKDKLILTDTFLSDIPGVSENNNLTPAQAQQKKQRVQDASFLGQRSQRDKKNGTPLKYRIAKSVLPDDEAEASEQKETIGRKRPRATTRPNKDAEVPPAKKTKTGDLQNEDHDDDGTCLSEKDPPGTPGLGHFGLFSNGLNLSDKQELDIFSVPAASPTFSSSSGRTG